MDIQLCERFPVFGGGKEMELAVSFSQCKVGDRSCSVQLVTAVLIYPKVYMLASCCPDVYVLVLFFLNTVMSSL